MSKMRDFKITERITDSSRNLSRYFTEISKEKMLSVDEEVKLAYLAKEGNEEAKSKLIKANLRFVVSVAKSYYSKKTPLEDLISEGNQGLVEAIEKFDPSTGFKFISYAVWHIRKNIMAYLSKNSSTVRIPQNVYSDLRKYKKIEDRFISSFGREPAVEEILDLIEENNIENISIGTVKNIGSSLPSTIPLESFGNNSEDDSYSPINWISSEDNPEKFIENSESDYFLKEAMINLNDIEKKAVKMRYGLENTDPSTLSEIGNYFERTGEWARNILRKAEAKMKRSIIRKNLRARL